MSSPSKHLLRYDTQFAAKGDGIVEDYNELPRAEQIALWRKLAREGEAPIKIGDGMPDLVSAETLHGPSSVRSSSSSAQHFDVVIGWQPLVEEIVAYVCFGATTLIAMKGSKEFSQEQLDMCKGKRVLICGSYFSCKEILRLSTTATSVRVWFYSSADMMRCSRGLCDLWAAHGVDVQSRPDVGIDRFIMDKFKAFPRATRLLRRSLEPDHEEHNNDEAFYRGLMHQAFETDETHEQVICQWLTRCTLPEEPMIVLGTTLATEHERIAHDIVKNGSQVVTRKDGVKIRVVVSSCALVMPVANEAAQGVDIGVVVRYDLANKTTMLTFVTHNKTSLAFVDKHPWIGGGRDTCKGTTLKFMHSTQAVLDSLSFTAQAFEQTSKQELKKE